MNSNANADLFAILAQAVEIDDDAERNRFMRAASGGDAAVCAQLQELARDYFAAGSLLDPPASISLLAGEEGKPGDELAVLDDRLSLVGQTIGPYLVRERIGEGGMGSVYVADQQQPLRRRVALKVIKPGMDSHRVIARFQAERQALALMDHPHIAKVFDAGTTPTGHPYFVMELVTGQPITEYCQMRRLGVRERLALFQQVCQAVQHAHLKGIIHRDLKPSNVIVSHGNPIPAVKVIDFGIAKATDPSLGEATAPTKCDQLLGTPLYMSPEQAGLSTLDIDTRSDIYSLGVLLYELLTGTTPFGNPSLPDVGFEEVCRLIREVDPPRPSSRVTTRRAPRDAPLGDSNVAVSPLPRRQLRGELDWIVMKAMEKDRNRRYPTANALSADIDRYLRCDPVDARPPSPIYRSRKLMQRYRLPLLALAGVLAAFVAATMFSLREARLAHAARQLADQRLAGEEAARIQIEDRESRLRLQLYASDVTAAWAAWSSGDHAQALQRLERHLPADGPPADLREFAWHFLFHRCRQQPVTLSGHTLPILGADVASDGRLIASSDRGGGIHIWDARDCREIAAWNYSHREVTTVAFSPDGSRLASAGQDSTVRLWTAGSWREQTQFTGHQNTVMCVAWSPDGRWLASSCRGGEVRIWNVESNQLEICLADQQDVVRVLAWSPDGKLLAAADGSKLRIWNTSDWNLRCMSDDLAGSILSLVFSPGGEWLACGGYRGRLVVCDPGTGRELTQARCMSAIWSLAFSPDGRHLLAGSGEGGPQLFRIHFLERHLQLQRTAFQRGGTQRAIRFADAGRKLLIAMEESKVLQMWDFQSQLGYQLTSYPDPCVGILPHPRWAVTADSLGTVTLRGYRGQQDGPRLTGHQQPVAFAVTDASERWLATCGRQGEVIVWELATASVLQRFTTAEDVCELCFAPTGATLAICSETSGVQLWDIATGSQRPAMEAPPVVRPTVAFSSDGRLMAIATADEPRIYLWDWHQGQLYATLEAEQGFHRLRFSHDNSRLLAGGKTSGIQVWDVAAALPQARWEGHRGPVRDLDLSPDGRTLATLGIDLTIRLWHFPTAQELFILSQDQWPHRIAFASDNSLVAIVEGTAPGDRALAIFDVGP